MYIVTLYVKAWFSATKAIEAPNNDLTFLKAMAHYDAIENTVLQRLVNKFCGHLWYLSDEPVALALFDQNVTFDIKRKMANNIRIFAEDEEKYEEELSDEEVDQSSNEDSDGVDDIEAEDDKINSGASGAEGRSRTVIGFTGVKRITLAPTEVHQKIMKDLSHYVTPGTANFFSRFGLPISFLNSDPET